MRRAARGALLLLGLMVACEGGSTPSTPKALPPGTAVSAEPGRALGIGEPRNPQPFTIDQRLRDAVQRDDRATVERALERGANLAATDELGRSVVLLATMDAGDLDLVRWLHEKGAALDQPDANGRTAVSFAAEAGRLDILRYLAGQGADLHRRDGQQRTPLFHAALGDHPDVLAFLVEHGGDVNVRDQFGDTPLIVACAKGNADSAAFLLAHGADPKARDQEGRSARDRAAPDTAPCRDLPSA